MRLTEHGRERGIYKYMHNEDPGFIDIRLALLLRVLYFQERRVNNNQQAVALSVAKFVEKRTNRTDNRVMVSMPAGMGKSVVIGLLANILAQDFTNILLIYSTEELYKFEAEMVYNLSLLLSKDVKFAVKLP